MASEVDICNQALIAVGADQILSLDAASKEGILCKALYPKFRDQEITKATWNFALKRQEIAASATPPIYGYALALPLPSELLRLIDVQTSSISSVALNNGLGSLNRQAWKVEGRSILADEAPLNILYLQRVIDTTLFPIFFTEVLAAKLAMEFVIPLRNSDMSLLDRMIVMYKEKTSMARFSDAVEDATKVLEAEQWIESRGDFSDSQVPRRVVGPAP